MYTERGSQTLNLTQKTRENQFKGFTLVPKEVQITKFDIDDAFRIHQLGERAMMKMEYRKTIEDVVNDKIKHPNCLINAETLASHISIVSTKSGENNAAVNKSGTNSSKSGGVKNSSKMKTSQSALKESTNKSQPSDKLSESSVNQTQTGAQTSETNMGDFSASLTKNVVYEEEKLPDTMMRAIRIIERLLTQTKYHEQHVLYKNYPPMMHDKNKKTLEEEEEEEKAKKPLFG